MISRDRIKTAADEPRETGSRQRAIEMNNEVLPFQISLGATVRQAMEQLERTEEKVVFVVDEQQRLVGSLTDGDIRRWILSDGDLKGPVGKVCNRHPFVVEEGYDLEAIRREMVGRNISCVPVLGGSGRIVQLLFWKTIFQGQHRENPRRRLTFPVAIMAGGLGTRLEPFTKVLPKPLIPVGDRTMIEIVIDQFLPYGLSKFFVSVNYKSKIIKSYFDDLAPAYEVAYLEETQPLGTAGSLRPLYAEDADSVLVTNCDIVVQADYGEIADFHETKENDITLVASLKDYRIPYGVCEIEPGGGLKQIREKPEYSFLVNTGMYLIRRRCLGLIPDGTRYDMPSLMEEVKRTGGRVGVFPIGENAWIDTGEWTEYRKAVDNLKRLGLQAGPG